MTKKQSGVHCQRAIKGQTKNFCNDSGYQRAITREKQHRCYHDKLLNFGDSQLSFRAERSEVAESIDK